MNDPTDNTGKFVGLTPDGKRLTAQPPVTLAPSGSILAASLAGTPLAVLTVSLLNRSVFDTNPLSVEEAVAFGAVGASIFGYLFHIAKTLIDRAIERAQ